MQKNTDIARKLRKNATKQEHVLWNLLRNSKLNNHKFKRQYPIGNYIVDFVCIEKFLIVELDGGQHNYIENKIADEERTNYLQSRGYKVIRFWNNDIDKNIEGVYEEIMKNLG